jgi:hypothetical protein
MSMTDWRNIKDWGERELLHASYDLYTNQDQNADGALHYIDDSTDSSIRVAKNYDLKMSSVRPLAGTIEGDVLQFGCKKTFINHPGIKLAPFLVVCFSGWHRSASLAE